MNTEKKELTSLKKHGLTLLMTLIYCVSVIGIFIIQSMNSKFYDVIGLDIEEALYMLCHSPIAYICAFGFSLVAGLLLIHISEKYRSFPYICIVSATISLVVYSAFSIACGLFGFILYLCLFFIGMLPYVLIAFGNKKVKVGKFIKKVICIVLSLAVISSSYFGLKKSIVYDEDGEPDKTGSWSAINQILTRNKDWKQIVHNSEFKLGEDKIHTEDGYTQYYQEMGSYPTLDGSTVCVPMAMEFARQHLNFSDEQCEEFTLFSTTHYAYESLIYGRNAGRYYSRDDYQIVDMMNDKVDLILATEPSEDELDLAENIGVTLVKKPICYDAFVFITHKDNPVDSLTIKQVRDIYSGKIKNWKDVGGNDEKIQAYQREENSGSQTAMENLVMNGKNMIDPIFVTEIMGMGGLINAVAEYRNDMKSLGYTYRFYIDTLYKNDNIKTIAIEGVQPTDDNIRSGKYPFSTNYYGVIRAGEENGTGGKFLDWILSEEGQSCLEQVGYISMKSVGK